MKNTFSMTQNPYSVMCPFKKQLIMYQVRYMLRISYLKFLKVNIQTFAIKINDGKYFHFQKKTDSCRWTPFVIFSDMYVYIYIKYVIKSLSNFYIYISLYIQTLQFKARHCNGILLLDLLASLYLLLCLQVFIISVLLFKSLHSLYVAISFLIEI